ncbi:hypothetical protein BDV25DRAFT_128415 [Aspergillus avenaceus]|uniref:Tim44-like domain-containing protein n=1 Tax=Aspergillus avenaceus TaxID=36643 RepID=A0A5N6TZV5_ASPAV|nr:hypothetical protein BDV25DRAFT_128415 [Aspergillus avenaceus]
MASSLSKGSLFSPVRSQNPIYQLYSCQCRLFSHSSQRNALRGAPENIAVKQPPQPSMKTRGKTMSRHDLPQDLGVLPGTFIKPRWRELPSIFQFPRERLQFEWLWIKTGFMNFASLVAYSKWLHKLPLRLKERRQVARELHQHMYSAFAKGDVGTLRKICCTGLANNLKYRIESRPKDEKVTWSLDKYNRGLSTLLTGVRVVSDRATQIPDLADSGIRQVVVRITSKQSTGKFKVDKSGAPVEESTPTKQQDCTEYIVIQKLRWLGEEGEWRLWGHTTFTSMDDLSSPAFAPGLTLNERMEGMKDEMMGKK